MPDFVIALIVLAVFAGIFVLSYVLNKRTPKPEGCDEIDESCLSCSNTLCRNKPKNKEEIESQKEE